jgi:hypothetical protein
MLSLRAVVGGAQAGFSGRRGVHGSPPDAMTDVDRVW